jgi:N-acetylglutamate synthase-like GNAT family acetyltransferase
MDIVYDNTLSVLDYNSLRKSVGWYTFSERQTQAGLCNSTYIIAAKKDGQTIGMARVISDGGYVAFVMDVVVLPEYRSNGIGKTMLQRIMSYLKSTLGQGEKLYVGLMAAKDREGYYKQFGFLERPNDRMGAGMSQWIEGDGI